MSMQSGPLWQDSGHSEAYVILLSFFVLDQDLVCMNVATGGKLFDLMPYVALARKVFQEGASAVYLDVCPLFVFFRLQIADLAVHSDGVAAMLEATHLEEQERLLVVELQVITPHIDFTLCLLHEGVEASCLV